MKSSLQEFNRKVVQEEKRISKHENMIIGIMKSEEQKEKQMKISKQRLMDLRNSIKQANICIMRIPEE